MSVARIQDAVGVVDGSNRMFRTPIPYVPGSVVLFLNGQRKVISYDDGWIESGGDQVELKMPPVAGDFVAFYYVPA